MSSFEEKRKDLTRRIVDKIATDPQFREQMATDPVEALTAAGFSKEIHDLEEQGGGAEVSGYARPQFLDSWGCP